MLSWIPSCLKIFLEKYFITTIASVLGAIIAIAFTPDTYWLLQRLGVLYFIGIFCLCFLLFYGCTNIVLFIKEKICEWEVDSIEKQKIIDDIRTFYDLCSQEELDIAYSLLKNNNMPLTITHTPGLYGHHNDPWLDNFDYSVISFNILRIKFKKAFYLQLKKIYSKYGRISNFER